VIAAAISFKSRLLPMASFATLYDIYKNEIFDRSPPQYIQQFENAVERHDESKALYYAYIVALFFNGKSRILKKIEDYRGSRNTELIEKWVEEYRRGKELLLLTGSVVLLFRDLHYSHGEYKNGTDYYVGSVIKKATIPDRAYDKHTMLGKKMGRGLKHFFEQGASVKRERFVNDWEEAGRNAYYSADRQGLGKSSKIIEAIKRRI
jgi:hypothetical protein